MTTVAGNSLFLRHLAPGRWWHPWQVEAPAPPEIEPPAGTWSDRPWRGGLHRLVMPDSVCAEDVWVHATSAAWGTWRVRFADGRASTTFTAGGTGDRWYRYPDPPPDVR